jgi:hypothetical protein
VLQHLSPSVQIRHILKYSQDGSRHHSRQSDDLEMQSMDIPDPPVSPSVVSLPSSPATQDSSAKNDQERSPVSARSVPSNRDENDADSRASMLENSLREEQEQHEQMQKDWEQERSALTAKRDGGPNTDGRRERAEDRSKGSWRIQERM